MKHRAKKMKLRKEKNPHKKFFGGWKLTLILFIALLIFLILAINTPSGIETQDGNGYYRVPVLFSQDTAEGQEYIRGVELAVNEVNERLSFPLARYAFCEIIPVYMNTAAGTESSPDAKSALTNFYDAYDFNCRFFIGPAGSTETESVAPFAEMLHAVILSPGASSSDLRDYPNYVFSLYPSDRYLSANLVSVVEKSIGNAADPASVAVVYDTRTYPIGIKKEFEEAAEKYDTIHPGYILLDETERSIHEAVSAVKEQNPQAIVFLPGSYQQAYAFISEAKAEGISAFWAGIEYCYCAEVAELFASPDKNEVFYVFTPCQTIIDEGFMKKYEDAYGSACTSEAAYGYDAMKIVDTLVQTGHGDPEDAAAHLKNMRYIGVTGIISFDETGAQYPKYDVLTIRDGEWVIESWKNIMRFENMHPDAGKHS